MSDDVLVFYAHDDRRFGRRAQSRVTTSKLWRLAFLAPQDVQLTLLHLHQFRRLDYHAAGSLIQLALPAPSSALEFAMPKRCRYEAEFEARLRERPRANPG